MRVMKNKTLFESFQENLKEYDKKKLNESIASDTQDEFESYNDFTDGDIVRDVIENYKKITGKDIKEVFNYSKDENNGFFKQSVIDETAPSIEEYLKEKGLSQNRIDEIYYKLDEVLSGMWNDYVPSDLNEAFDLDDALADVTAWAECMYKGSEINSSTISSLLNSKEELKDKYTDNQKAKIVKWFEDEEKKYMPADLNEDGSPMKKYVVKLKHDDGTVEIETTATSKEQAIKQVCDAEKAPESAVIDIIEKGEVIEENVFDGYEKALPTVNDGREYLGYNLSDVVDAVESFYGCKDRREAFDKIKNKLISDEDIKQAIKHANLKEADETVRVVTTNRDERDYAVTDITELNEVADGDVQPPIDITGLLVEVDNKLTESYGNWGQINFQSTRFNVDTKDSNALFELRVGDKNYLMSMLLEENGSLLKVNNTDGKTIYKAKSRDVLSLAESYIKQFIPKPEEVPFCLTNMNMELHSRLDFLKSYIDLYKKAPKEDKEMLKGIITNDIYGFVAELSDEIKANEPTDEDKLELPTFDKMVEEVFGKEWVKEEQKENKLELDGVEQLKESIVRYNVYKDETPVAQDVTDLDNAKKIAKDENATVITKYTWSNEEDYNKYKEADKTEDIYLNEDYSYTASVKDKSGKGIATVKGKIKATNEKDAKGKVHEILTIDKGYKTDDIKNIKVKLEESDEPIEAIGYEVRYLQQVGPGVYQSVDAGTYESSEQAEDRVAELRAQGFDASMETLWNREEDPDYDKNADETNWAAEEEADAIERMEHRYGSINESEQPEENIEVQDTEDEVVDLKEPKSGLGTGYAQFYRKPKNITELEQGANAFTSGEASYIICDRVKLTKDEFDRMQDDFQAPNEYCKSFEPLDVENYSYNVIEFSCDGYDYKLLVDPSNHDNCRWVAKLGGTNNEIK